ncbi:hypothetical protein ACFL3S_07165 [Gemmatimonadota bacterium]
MMAPGGGLEERPDGYGKVPRSHLLPRTRQGWTALVGFLVLFFLAEPPIVHGLANRVEPWIFGLPFLYAYLLAVYSALILVLIWALRKKL